VAFIDDWIERVRPYTKSTPERLHSMADALMAIEIDKVPGDVVECGVWRGGNLMLARLIAPGRTCWAYDTFDGMTEPDEELDVKRPNEDGRPGERAIDRYRAKVKGGTKWDAINLESVQQGFRDENLLDDHMRWISGAVEETLYNQPVPKAVAVLRLDVDWYWPTRVALERLYPCLAVGGFLIVDDYGHWMGCKKAVDDYIFSKPLVMTVQVDYSCVVFRKC